MTNMKNLKFKIIYLDKAEKRAHSGGCSYWTPKKPCGDLAYMITSPDYLVSQFTGKYKDGEEVYK